MDALDAHRSLVAKVDAFFDAAVERDADLKCGAGCTACCEVDLTVSPIEADRARAALAERGPWKQTPGACVMLDHEGRCAIYEARPLVCRSQGLPLAYPDGVIPPDAVRGRAGAQALTWCPLNFTESPPTGPDVFDAGRLDEALAIVNRAYCAERGLDPLARTSLRDLVERPD